MKKLQYNILFINDEILLSIHINHFLYRPNTNTNLDVFEYIYALRSKICVKLMLIGLSNPSEYHDHVMLTLGKSTLPQPNGGLLLDQQYAIEEVSINQLSDLKMMFLKLCVIFHKHKTLFCKSYIHIIPYYAENESNFRNTIFRSESQLKSSVCV